MAMAGSRSGIPSSMTFLDHKNIFGVAFFVNILNTVFFEIKISKYRRNRKRFPGPYTVYSTHCC